VGFFFCRSCQIWLTGFTKYATGNKAQSTEGQKLTKVDRENEVAPPQKIDQNVGKAMAKARLEKEPVMTQKDLATKVNEKPSVINDYESGKAVPNQQVLAKLERALGVKLRGKGWDFSIYSPIFLYLFVAS
jgi:putative transcription factor